MILKNEDFVEFVINKKSQILGLTIEHIELTLIALVIALVIGLPLGILISRYKRLAGIVLGGVGVIQTIPSLALLGFLLPFFGIGPLPAVIALFLYALLPIIRNTYAGINEIDSSVKEAAYGMGMSNLQVLLKIELPLATPIIFAGIRTATIINVGVATICALIASGGLGELIYSGIALNNINMILAGAIPAAILAILFDFILGIIQKFIHKIIRPFLFASISIILIFSLLLITNLNKKEFTAGFVAEFMERSDGYPGLQKKYGLNLKTKELDSQLMFQALKGKRVNLIGGYSTEGRIKAYDFEVLKDDKNFFPPYEACPLIRSKTLNKYPFLIDIFSKIGGKITNEKMTELNYHAEYYGMPTKEIAREFLNDLGLKTSIERSGKPDIVIGSKNFTEQFILAEIFSILIENYSNLNVELEKGLAGTKLCFDSLINETIDLYPEYTGTGLFAILKISNEPLLSDSKKIYEYVKKQSREKYNIEWLQPLGFNNTWALMMRKEEAEKLNIKTISDLKQYLNGEA